MSATATSLTPWQRDLLAAARSDDEAAFERLVEPHRGELHAHCYRMLGSVHDAEDALQDALLRAWRGAGAFEGRSSLRSWLYTIATNTCLNAIAKRPKRVLPIDYGPPPTRRRARASRSSSRSGSSPTRTSARRRGRLRGARGALRAARERRARVHRRAAAPAGQPARGADPARGARLLGARRSPTARDDHRLGQQRAAAGPRRRSRSASRSRASRRRCARSATRAARARRRATSTRGSAATSTRRRDARRGRRVLDAAAGAPGSAARRRSRTFLAGWPLSGLWRWSPSVTTANGQPALAFYSWDDDEQRLPAVRAQRAHAARRRRSARSPRSSRARPRIPPARSWRGCPSRTSRPSGSPRPSSDSAFPSASTEHLRPHPRRRRERVGLAPRRAASARSRPRGRRDEPAVRRPGSRPRRLRRERPRRHRRPHRPRRRGALARGLHRAAGVRARPSPAPGARWQR